MRKSLYTGSIIATLAAVFGFIWLQLSYAPSLGLEYWEEHYLQDTYSAIGSSIFEVVICFWLTLFSSVLFKPIYPAMVTGVALLLAVFGLVVNLVDVSSNSDLYRLFLYSFVGTSIVMVLVLRNRLPKSEQ